MSKKELQNLKNQFRKKIMPTLNMNYSERAHYIGYNEGIKECIKVLNTKIKKATN